jgi:lipoprotein-anchoring transpeptidase ErfK/SrfK
MQKRYKMVVVWMFIICFLFASMNAITVRRFTITTITSTHASQSMTSTNENDLSTSSFNLPQSPAIQLGREAKKQTRLHAALHVASILGKNILNAPKKSQAKSGMTALTSNGQDKFILINVSNQWMHIYQGGKQIANTPITTGRPGLDTPIGTFHVFNKKSPTTFYSMWSPGSFNYFAPTHINFALEFLYPGYFIHDSLWRHDYGPGSNGPHYVPGYGFESGSHGCVNVPYSTMNWLYSWADINTAVQLTY